MVVRRSMITGWKAPDVLVLLVIFEENARPGGSSLVAFVKNTGLGDSRGGRSTGGDEHIVVRDL